MKSEHMIKPKAFSSRSSLATSIQKINPSIKSRRSSFVENLIAEYKYDSQQIFKKKSSLGQTHKNIRQPLMDMNIFNNIKSLRIGQIKEQKKESQRKDAKKVQKHRIQKQKATFQSQFLKTMSFNSKKFQKQIKKPQKINSNNKYCSTHNKIQQTHNDFKHQQLLSKYVMSLNYINSQQVDYQKSINILVSCKKQIKQFVQQNNYLLYQTKVHQFFNISLYLLVMFRYNAINTKNQTKIKKLIEKSFKLYSQLQKQHKKQFFVQKQYNSQQLLLQLIQIGYLLVKSIQIEILYEQLIFLKQKNQPSQQTQIKILQSIESIQDISQNYSRHPFYQVYLQIIPLKAQLRIKQSHTNNTLEQCKQQVLKIIDRIIQDKLKEQNKFKNDKLLELTELVKNIIKQNNINKQYLQQRYSKNVRNQTYNLSIIQQLIIFKLDIIYQFNKHQQSKSKPSDSINLLAFQIQQLQKYLKYNLNPQIYINYLQHITLIIKHQIYKTQPQQRQQMVQQLMEMESIWFFKRIKFLESMKDGNFSILLKLVACYYQMGQITNSIRVVDQIIKLIVFNQDQQNLCLNHCLIIHNLFNHNNNNISNYTSGMFQCITPNILNYLFSFVILNKAYLLTVNKPNNSSIILDEFYWFNKNQQLIGLLESYCPQREFNFNNKFNNCLKLDQQVLANNQLLKTLRLTISEKIIKNRPQVKTIIVKLKNEFMSYDKFNYEQEVSQYSEISLANNKNYSAHTQKYKQFNQQQQQSQQKQANQSLIDNQEMYINLINIIQNYQKQILQQQLHTIIKKTK